MGFVGREALPPGRGMCVRGRTGLRTIDGFFFFEVREEDLRRAGTVR